jgi:hypothetical protein
MTPTKKTKKNKPKNQPPPPFLSTPFLLLLLTILTPTFQQQIQLSQAASNTYLTTLAKDKLISAANSKSKLLALTQTGLLYAKAQDTKEAPFVLKVPKELKISENPVNFQGSLDCWQHKDTCVVCGIGGCASVSWASAKLKPDKFFFHKKFENKNFLDFPYAVHTLYKTDYFVVLESLAGPNSAGVVRYDAGSANCYEHFSPKFSGNDGKGYMTESMFSSKLIISHPSSKNFLFMDYSNLQYPISIAAAPSGGVIGAVSASSSKVELNQFISCVPSATTICSLYKLARTKETVATPYAVTLVRNFKQVKNVQAGAKVVSVVSIPSSEFFVVAIGKAVMVFKESASGQQSGGNSGGNSGGYSGGNNGGNSGGNNGGNNGGNGGDLPSERQASRATTVTVQETYWALASTEIFGLYDREGTKEFMFWDLDKLYFSTFTKHSSVKTAIPACHPACKPATTQSTGSAACNNNLFRNQNCVKATECNTNFIPTNFAENLKCKTKAGTGAVVIPKAIDDPSKASIKDTSKVCTNTTLLKGPSDPKAVNPNTVFLNKGKTKKGLSIWWFVIGGVLLAVAAGVVAMMMKGKKGTNGMKGMKGMKGMGMGMNGMNQMNMGNMDQMGNMGNMDQMGNMGKMGKMGKMGDMGGMGDMGDMGYNDGMGYMGDMGNMDNSMIGNGMMDNSFNNGGGAYDSMANNGMNYNNNYNNSKKSIENMNSGMHNGTWETPFGF